MTRFSYLHFNSSFTSDYLPKIPNEQALSMWQMLPSKSQTPTHQQPGESKPGQARKVMKVINSECFWRSCRYLDTSRLKEG